MALFRNLDGSGPHELSAVFRWAVVDRVLGRRRKSPASAEVPYVKTDAASVARPPVGSEPPRLTWLGHASWLVQLDGASILIDPIFGQRISYVIPRVVPAPLLPGELPRIDATLVTHGHYDHYDRPSVVRAGAPVFLGKGLGSDLRLPRTELSWWESAQVSENVRVTFVPSQHWHRRTLFDTNHALWGGFVIEGKHARLYHSGDTAYFAGFAEIGRRFPGIDAAMLPIGAYDPEWFMSKQHMNPEQAAQAFADLGARNFFAMHWGTFKLTDEPLLEPPERIRAEWARRGLQPEALHVVAVGETQTAR
ncbi:MAG TPA: MBL fold metallo-hydrolase [Myxococcales bacterium]|jgi:L-ascorbate metabolism protein UlaG (beta-lactamase superfamily)